MILNKNALILVALDIRVGIPETDIHLHRPRVDWDCWLSKRMRYRLGHNGRLIFKFNVQDVTKRLHQ